MIEMNEETEGIELVEPSSPQLENTMSYSEDLTEENMTKDDKENGVSSNDSPDIIVEESKEQELREQNENVLTSSKSNKSEIMMKDEGIGNKNKRRCQKRFRDMVGTYESKNENLAKKEGELRDRLEMLEYSMPAVMVWNICRMAREQGSPSLKQTIEEHFVAGRSLDIPGDQTCPVWCDGSIENRPSRHYDLRVRETEAERKIAEKRTEDARSLWFEKKAALKEKMKELGSIEKIVSERTELINKLSKDIEEIEKQNAEMEAEDSVDCECGDSQCRERWLAKVSRSASSIQSTDLEYLERLEELAANEISMKKDIADLERREKAHMRILQQADQFWASTENSGDSRETTPNNVQTQLNAKMTANQQLSNRVCELEDELEKLTGKLSSCKNELDKYVNIDRTEAAIGGDDDIATVADKSVRAGKKMTNKAIGRKDDIAEVSDKASLAKVRTADVGIEQETFEPIETKINSILGGITDENLRNEAQQYLNMLESLDDLDEVDDDYACSSEYPCDEEGNLTGFSEAELAEMGLTLSTAKLVLEEKDSDVERRKKESEIEDPKGEATIPRKELKSWLGFVRSIRETISKCPSCVVSMKDADNLMKRIAKYAKINIPDGSLLSDEKSDDDDDGKTSHLTGKTFAYYDQPIQVISEPEEKEEKSSTIRDVGGSPDHASMLKFVSEEKSLDREKVGIEQTVEPEMDEKQNSTYRSPINEMEVKGGERMIVPTEDPTTRPKVAELMQPSSQNEKREEEEEEIIPKHEPVEFKLEKPEYETERLEMDEEIQKSQVPRTVGGETILPQETDSGDLRGGVMDQFRDEIESPAVERGKEKGEEMKKSEARTVEEETILAQETDSGDLQKVVMDQFRDGFQEEEREGEMLVSSLPQLSGLRTEGEGKYEEKEAMPVDSQERKMEKSDTKEETFPIVDAKFPKERMEMKMKGDEGKRVEKEFHENMMKEGSSLESLENDKTITIDVNEKDVSLKQHKHCHCKKPRRRWSKRGEITTRTSDVITQTETSVGCQTWPIPVVNVYQETKLKSQTSTAITKSVESEAMGRPIQWCKIMKEKDKSNVATISLGAQADRSTDSPRDRRNSITSYPSCSEGNNVSPIPGEKIDHKPIRGKQDVAPTKALCPECKFQSQSKTTGKTKTFYDEKSMNRKCNKTMCTCKNNNNENQIYTIHRFKRYINTTDPFPGQEKSTNLH